MENNCVLILPYFGKLPNYFNMFLKSCSSNTMIDWLIISDQKCPQKYENIQWINMSFDDFKKMIESRFDFPISLETPYKLCDYKPAYGFILEKYIKNYDYWGHCDCDLIFGNLNKMLIPLLKKNYDKIFAAGHLTVYKNTKKNNITFMRNNPEGISLYRATFSHNRIFGFDEDLFEENVHTIFQTEGYNLFEKDLSFNVSSRFYNINRVFYNDVSHNWEDEPFKRNIVVWDGNNIYCYNYQNGNINKTEYLYIHLQMRKMKNTIIPEKEYYVKIAPDRFEKITKMTINKNIWKKQKKIYLSWDIITNFFRNKYYKIRGHEKKMKQINPYKAYK